MTSEEWQLLARGPKYCVVRSCKEEDIRVEIETSILKHKWDCMGQECDANLSEEERIEQERVAFTTVKTRHGMLEASGLQIISITQEESFLKPCKVRRRAT